MQWWKRIRGAVGTGVTWAVAWAGMGVGIGVLSLLTPFLPWEWLFARFDAPLPTLALPGFIAGVLFSVVVHLAAGRRRLEELSIPRFAGYGAIGGLLLALVPATLVALNLAHLGNGPDVLTLTAVLSVPFVLLSTISAAGTLFLARRAAVGERGMRRTDDLREPALVPAAERTALGTGGASFVEVARHGDAAPIPIDGTERDHRG